MLIRAQPRSLVGMLDALRKMNDIYEIYDVTGQYYSILKIRTDSTEQLSKIIDEIGMIDGVAGTETVIVLRTVKEELGVIVWRTRSNADWYDVQPNASCFMHE